MQQKRPWAIDPVAVQPPAPMAAALGEVAGVGWGVAAGVDGGAIELGAAVRATVGATALGVGGVDALQAVATSATETAKTARAARDIERGMEVSLGSARDA